MTLSVGGTEPWHLAARRSEPSTVGVGRGDRKPTCRLSSAPHARRCAARPGGHDAGLLHQLVSRRRAAVGCEAYCTRQRLHCPAPRPSARQRWLYQSVELSARLFACALRRRRRFGSITHYASGQAAVFFGSGYVSLGEVRRAPFSWCHSLPRCVRLTPPLACLVRALARRSGGPFSSPCLSPSHLALPGVRAGEEQQRRAEGVWRVTSCCAWFCSSLASRCSRLASSTAWWRWRCGRAWACPSGSSSGGTRRTWHVGGGASALLCASGGPGGAWGCETSSTCRVVGV